MVTLSLSLSLSLSIWPCHGPDGQSPVSHRGRPTTAPGTQIGAWHSEIISHPSVLQFSRSTLTTQLLRTHLCAQAAAAAASRRTNGRSLGSFQSNVLTKFRECLHFLFSEAGPVSVARPQSAHGDKVFRSF